MYNTNANANDDENSITTNDRKKNHSFWGIFFFWGGIDMIGFENYGIEFLKKKKKKSPIVHKAPTFVGSRRDD